MTLVVEPPGLGAEPSAELIPHALLVDVPVTTGPARPEARVPTRLRTAGPLSLILLVQGLMWLREQPFASPSEALSLYTGHLDMRRMAAAMAGSPSANHVGAAAAHSSYLSATGYLYPLVAGFSASLGGLVGARLLSLALMLASTVLVCGLARRLFGDLAGVVAAGLFTAATPTLFLGHLAQYDAMAIFALSLAARLSVTAVARTDARGVLAPALAGTAAAISAFTGPAGLLFAPLIGLLVVASTSDSARAPGKVIRLTAFLSGAGAAAGLIIGVLPLLDGGVRGSWAGWRPDTVYGSVAATIGSTLWDIGPALVLALAAVAIAIASRSSRRTIAVVIALATGSVAGLVYAVALHNGPSPLELAGFSLVFAATLGGEAAHRLFDRLRGKAVIPMVAGLLAVLSFAGATFSANFSWKSESRLVGQLSKVVRPGGDSYLVAQPIVPEYYLSDQSLPRQFVSTLSFVYTDPVSGRRLVGRAAYAKAIGDGYFSMIALPVGGGPGSIDSFLRSTIAASAKYHVLSRWTGTRSENGWDVWTLRSDSPPTASLSDEDRH